MRRLQSMIAELETLKVEITGLLARMEAAYGMTRVMANCHDLRIDDYKDMLSVVNAERREFVEMLLSEIPEEITRIRWMMEAEDKILAGIHKQREEVAKISFLLDHALGAHQGAERLS